jgi:hypothetical protein
MMNLEQATDLKHNPMWDVLCEEVDRMIEAKKEEFCICRTEDTLYIQASIKALRSLKSLPQDIIDREQ